MLTFMGSSQSPELRPRGRAAGGAEATMTTPSTSAPFAASPQSARSDEHGDDDGDDRLNAFSMRHAPTASTTTAAAAAPAATTYIIDGDGESWNTQSIRRATLVHDGVCAMRVRDARAKERRIDARVRVMVGAGSGDGGGEGKDVDGDGANNGVASRTLRVHVSCDDDPFFYHAMEVREEDYARLRSEQRLVVDFDAFPRALVGLLRACDGAGGNKDVYCMLESTEASSSSVLSIVETNAFNQFTHVALKFKPASDRAAKRILAGLLLDAKERERELQRFETLYRESQDALEISRSKSLEVQMKYAEASARGKREILDELEHARERFEQEKRELRARVDEALAQRSELEREKFAAQNKVSELGTKLGLIEGELTITKRELQRTREDNAALDAEVHERDKAHSSRALRVEWLEKQLGDKEEVIALLKSRLDATEEHKVALAASWEQARRSAAKAEERLAASAVEINKGNAIIEQLQNDLRTTKSKTKIQAAVIRRQENLLEERQTSMSEYAGDRAERSMETADLLDQVKTLKTREADLSAKIAESQALLTSNQQVIQWLNQQLTEASLSRAPGAAPSRVATRQPSTPPVAGRPSTSATANDANRPPAHRILPFAITTHRRVRARDDPSATNPHQGTPIRHHPQHRECVLNSHRRSTSSSSSSVHASHRAHTRRRDAHAYHDIRYATRRRARRDDGRDATTTGSTLPMSNDDARRRATMRDRRRGSTTTTTRSATAMGDARGYRVAPRIASRRSARASTAARALRR